MEGEKYLEWRWSISVIGTISFLADFREAQGSEFRDRGGSSMGFGSSTGLGARRVWSSMGAIRAVSECA